MSSVENNLPSARQRAIAFGLLWLSGACLRLTVLAVPPVIPLLHADLHLTETDVGWLSSLPPMLFAIAAVPGAVLIARFGIVPALVIGLLLNAFGSAARAAFAEPAMLYASTIAMAAGVSIMQPSLPPLVRAWFPQRIGFATAVYTTGLLIGEILAAGADYSSDSAAHRQQLATELRGLVDSGAGHRIPGRDLRAAARRRQDGG